MVNIENASKNEPTNSNILVSRDDEVDANAI